MNLGKFAVQAIKEWNPFGPEAYERRARNKAYRKARRDAKRQHESVSQPQEGMAMFPKGTQTLSGIAVLALVPWLAKYGIESEQVAALVAAVGTIFGGVTAVIGYFRRKKLPAE